MHDHPYNSVCMHRRVTVYLSSLSMYLSVCLSVCMSVPICLSACLSIYLSVCLSVCLCVCLSVTTLAATSFGFTPTESMSGFLIGFSLFFDSEKNFRSKLMA